MSGAEPAGYGKPPRASRFKPGRSGNPKGRPKNRRREIPYDAVLGQMVTIREDGRERRVTAAEAFLLQLTQKGLAGDSAAARSLLAAIETARAKHPEPLGIDGFAITYVKVGGGLTFGTLGMARRRYPKDEKRVRWELLPWIVEAALARLGDKRLSETEQREVWNNTRTPQKVNWPEWWTVRG